MIKRSTTIRTAFYAQRNGQTTPSHMFMESLESRVAKGRARVAKYRERGYEVRLLHEPLPVFTFDAQYADLDTPLFANRQAQHEHDARHRERAWRAWWAK